MFMLSIFQVAYHKGVTVIGRHIVIGGKFHIQFKVGTESPGHILLRDVIADQLSVDTGKRTPAVGTENTDIEDFRFLVHLVHASTICVILYLLSREVMFFDTISCSSLLHLLPYGQFLLSAK